MHSLQVNNGINFYTNGTNVSAKITVDPDLITLTGTTGLTNQVILTGVANPVNNNDAVNKLYLDTQISGISPVTSGGYSLAFYARNNNSTAIVPTSTYVNLFVNTHTIMPFINTTSIGTLGTISFTTPGTYTCGYNLYHENLDIAPAGTIYIASHLELAHTGTTWQTVATSFGSAYAQAVKNYKFTATHHNENVIVTTNTTTNIRLVTTCYPVGTAKTPAFYLPNTSSLYIYKH